MGATLGSGQPPFQAAQVGEANRQGFPGKIDLMQAISYMLAYMDKR